jgi:hypothetical protein
LDVSGFVAGAQINPSFIFPALAGLVFSDGSGGDSFSGAIDSFNALPFGSGVDPILADSSTGDIFEIQARVGFLGLPLNYISGSNINGTITFNNSTFATLGVTPGNYTYDLTNSSGDSIVLDIGVTPVPFEFSPVVGVSLLGGLWLGRKVLKRKKSK